MDIMDIMDIMDDIMDLMWSIAPVKHVFNLSFRNPFCWPYPYHCEICCVCVWGGGAHPAYTVMKRSHGSYVAHTLLERTREYFCCWNVTPFYAD